ncbi:hypothetical protein HUJ04_009344 [Dendroctonus ponderosae]|uniref:Cytochrome P450 n=3 Tax=Dendroctonus ponderosae TaxID=77166 RepID=A0AAR5P651_DENPD|nr:hypothetical protein HUJ04_009344 [Dendroctonus ponderosae]KAH1019541.1 hypothetical protein HUJ04_009344 [Dendroctonus ponderosae]
MLGAQAVLWALVALVSYLLIQGFRFRKVLSHIPSPPGHWLIGNLEFLMRNPYPGKIFEYLRDCAQRYGPIYRFSTLHIVVINLLHPDDMELVLSQMKHMKKSRLYKFLGGWLGEGLLTSSGQKWQKRRKLLTPAFHFNVLQKFLDIFNEETSNMVKQIEEMNAQSLGGKPLINLMPIVTNLTLQSITETALGVSSVEEDTMKSYRSNIHKMGQFVFGRVTKPWSLIPLVYSLSNDYEKESETIHSLHQFTYRVMKEREKQLVDGRDEQVVSTTYSGRKIMKMLDLLLYAKINEGTIDYEGIREEVDTFMFEGHDTTAAAITFLLYALAEHPDIQENVRKEIQSNITPTRTPTYHDLQDLPYTERVIKESLRLYPSVPLITREASEDFLSHTGSKIPKGTVLYLHIFDLHRNPDIYPDPQRFDPDRFLPENCANRHPFAYLPFSAGPRNCIGQKFAILEIKAVIVGLLRKFRLEPSGCAPPSFFVDLILRPEGPINVKFVPI